MSELMQLEAWTKELLSGLPYGYRGPAIEPSSDASLGTITRSWIRSGSSGTCTAPYGMLA